MIDIGVELSIPVGGLHIQRAHFRERNRPADKDCNTQSEVKQVRFAIAPLQESGAELGAAGAPESEVLIEMED